jgi:hypothetical protein
VVEIAGLVALTSVVCSVVLHFMRFLGDRKLVRAMIMKEMHETKEAGIRSGLNEK